MAKFRIGYHFSFTGDDVRRHMPVDCPGLSAKELRRAATVNMLIAAGVPIKLDLADEYPTHIDVKLDQLVNGAGCEILYEGFQISINWYPVEEPNVGSIEAYRIVGGPLPTLPRPDYERLRARLRASFDLLSAELRSTRDAALAQLGFADATARGISGGSDAAQHSEDGPLGGLAEDEDQHNDNYGLGELSFPASSPDGVAVSPRNSDEEESG